MCQETNYVLSYFYSTITNTPTYNIIVLQLQHRTTTFSVSINTIVSFAFSKLKLIFCSKLTNKLKTQCFDQWVLPVWYMALNPKRSIKLQITQRATERRMVGVSLIDWKIDPYIRYWPTQLQDFANSGGVGLVIFIEQMIIGGHKKLIEWPYMSEDFRYDGQTI